VKREHWFSELIKLFPDLTNEESITITNLDIGKVKGIRRTASLSETAQRAMDLLPRKKDETDDMYACRLHWEQPQLDIAYISEIPRTDIDRLMKMREFKVFTVEGVEVLTKYNLTRLPIDADLACRLAREHPELPTNDLLIMTKLPLTKLKQLPLPQWHTTHTRQLLETYPQNRGETPEAWAMRICHSEPNATPWEVAIVTGVRAEIIAALLSGTLPHVTPLSSPAQTNETQASVSHASGSSTFPSALNSGVWGNTLRPEVQHYSHMMLSDASRVMNASSRHSAPQTAWIPHPRVAVTGLAESTDVPLRAANTIRRPEHGRSFSLVAPGMPDKPGVDTMFYDFRFDNPVRERVPDVPGISQLAGIVPPVRSATQVREILSPPCQPGRVNRCLTTLPQIRVTLRISSCLPRRLTPCSRR